jgi:hypothetical protein
MDHELINQEMNFVLTLIQLLFLNVCREISLDNLRISEHANNNEVRLGFIMG